MAVLLYKELPFVIIGAAMEVHRLLGPGFLEVVYQKALAHELRARNIPFQEQVHQAQALHYLTATGLRLALLLNFGAGSFSSGLAIS